MTVSKSITTLFCLSILVFSTTSCSIDDLKDSRDSISEEEAVELVEASLQKSTVGLNEATKSYSEELTSDSTSNVLCDTLYEKTFPYTFNGDFIEAEYSIVWSYQVSCNNLNVPKSVVFNATSSGTYSTRRIESNDVSHVYFIISGLQPTSDNYSFKGDFDRVGNQQITTNQNTKSINSSISVEIEDLTVSKVSHEIVSGNGVLILAGNTIQGDSFLFKGTIVFNGNGTATLTLNGTSYEINLG